MNRRQFSLLLTLPLLARWPRPAHAAPDAAKANAPVVIELFTSQGCSSCPPADALMHEWAKQPGVIALSLHVDYWDYLGWRDTFGKRGHVERQQAYARHGGSRQVFTPQAMVDGQYPAIGSNREAVEAALQMARKDKHLQLSAAYDAAGRPQKLLIPGLKPWQGEATIWLCLYDKRHDVTVERGENRGKLLTYVNVARAWADLGRWSGEALSLDLTQRLGDYNWQEKGAVILVQASRGGPILGAIDLGRR